jgi:hypothetical protein
LSQTSVQIKLQQSLFHLDNLVEQTFKEIFVYVQLSKNKLFKIRIQGSPPFKPLSYKKFQ